MVDYAYRRIQALLVFVGLNEFLHIGDMWTIAELVLLENCKNTLVFVSELVVL